MYCSCFISEDTVFVDAQRPDADFYSITLHYRCGMAVTYKRSSIRFDEEREADTAPSCSVTSLAGIYWIDIHGVPDEVDTVVFVDGKFSLINTMKEVERCLGN